MTPAEPVAACAALPEARTRRGSVREVSPLLPWLVWGLAALLFCYGFFHRVAPSVMIDRLMSDLAVGGAVLGNLSAFYFYAYASLQIPVGLMHDRWGPRRMLSLGALLCSLGSLLFATAEAMPQAYFGRLLIGGGAGFGFVGALKLATVWFPPQQFARISGLTMMIGMAGGIAGQAPLAAVVELGGWRGVLLGAGLFGLLLAAAIWLVVRDSPRRAEREPVRRDLAAGSLLSALARVASTRENLLLALVAASMSGPLLAFASLWGVAWLMQSYGLPRPAAAGMASLVLLGWAFGSPAAGWLSDRLGRRRPLLVGGTLGGLLCLAAAFYLPALPGVLLSALLFAAGFCLGAMVVSFAVARDANPAELTGAAYGFVNCATMTSGAVLQPLIGWLLDLGWDGATEGGARFYTTETYRGAFSVMLVLLAMGAAAALALPRRRAPAAGGEPR